MKRLLFFFMALLVLGAVTGIADTGGEVVSRGTMHMTAADVPDMMVTHDVFVRELPETPGAFFNLSNGFFEESAVALKEVIPVSGCSRPAVSTMIV
jgi:hypothetical protein